MCTCHIESTKRGKCEMKGCVFWLLNIIDWMNEWKKMKFFEMRIFGKWPRKLFFFWKGVHLHYNIQIDSCQSIWIKFTLHKWLITNCNNWMDKLKKIFSKCESKIRRIFTKKMSLYQNIMLRYEICHHIFIRIAYWTSFL